jgi:hypothetical protein
MLVHGVSSLVCEFLLIWFADGRLPRRSPVHNVVVPGVRGADKVESSAIGGDGQLYTLGLLEEVRTE